MSHKIWGSDRTQGIVPNSVVLSEHGDLFVTLSHIVENNSIGLKSSTISFSTEEAIEMAKTILEVLDVKANKV